jgi:transposase InsO family protein
MPYTTNAKMPRIRREAAELYRRGWSARKVARHLGFHHTAVMKWVRKARVMGYGLIPTESSRPKSAPRAIDEKARREIIRLRVETKRCTEAIHLMLLKKGIKVSRNTVHRVLDRAYLLKKRSPWKRYHAPMRRPDVEKSGDLVQLDTIHRMIDEKRRLYILVLLDVYSRWVYAKAYQRMNAATSIRFVRHAQRRASFHFQMLQSDHGPEFGRWFASRVRKSHRYTRIGKPNDNAHIERFNRTIQEECLDRVSSDVFEINGALRKYLKYYNTKRIHLSLKGVPIEWC